MKELTMCEIESISGGRRPNGPVNDHAGGGFRLSPISKFVFGAFAVAAGPMGWFGRGLAIAIGGFLALF